MKIRKLNIKILGLKTILYRLIRVLSNVILFGVLLGNWSKAISYNVWLTLLATGQYFLFEYFFDKKKDVIIQTKGCVLWFTGLPCSGKTTIADRVARILKQEGKNIERLDGDIVRRQGLSDDLKFSKEDRDKNINRVTFVARVLSRNGVAVLCSFVSPYRKTRYNIREKTTNFIEIYVRSSARECAKRDVKGMWKLAKEGKITSFTGFDDPYEVPMKADLILNTETESITESTNKVLDYLKKKKVI